MALPDSELSRQSQLNIDSEKCSTKFLQNCKLIYYSYLPSNPIYFYLYIFIIICDCDQELRKVSCSQDSREQMDKWLDCDFYTPDLMVLWWEIRGSAITQLPFDDRQNLRRFIFLWLASCESVETTKWMLATYACHLTRSSKHMLIV